MRLFLGLAVSLAVAPLALAGPAATQKALNRRGEAMGVVDGISAGANPQAGASRLKFLGEETWAAGALAEALGKTVDERGRRNIVVALSLLGSSSAEGTLLGVLRDNDGAIRMAAVQGLGLMRSKAVGPLSAMLADKTLGVRREAARALGAAKVPKMGKVLITAAASEGEPEARAAMLVAAGQSGDPKQAKALEGYLEHSSESTRVGAAQGLCLLGSPQGFAFAQKLLASQDRYERRQALSLFEGSGAKQSAPVLKPLLEDPDPAIAAGAARLLHQGGDPGALQWLVLASHRAEGEGKLPYETELEKLRLADDQRKALLHKAGVK